MQRLARTLLSGLGLAALAACSDVPFLGGSKDGGSTKAKAPEETGKPSEDTEGVPGYLTDPAGIDARFEKSSGTVTLAAPKGAVARDGDGEVEAVTVSVYEVAVEEYLRAHGGDAVALAAKRVTSTKAAADGSFTVEFSHDSSTVLILTATVQTDTGKIRIAPKSARGAAAAVADGGVPRGFAPLEPEALRTDRRVPAAGASPSPAPAAPAPAAGPEPEQAPELPCGGKKVGGACWYLATSALDSCAKICTAHGGYDAATDTFAGARGTLQGCYEVMDALGAPGANLGSVASVHGVGCTVGVGGGRFQWAGAATTEAAILGGFLRACACKE